MSFSFYNCCSSVVFVLVHSFWSTNRKIQHFSCRSNTRAQFGWILCDPIQLTLLVLFLLFFLPDSKQTSNTIPFLGHCFLIIVMFLLNYKKFLKWLQRQSCTTWIVFYHWLFLIFSITILYFLHHFFGEGKILTYLYPIWSNDTHEMEKCHQSIWCTVKRLSFTAFISCNGKYEFFSGKCCRKHSAGTICRTQVF